MRLADIIPSILNGKTFVRKVDGELRVVYYRRRYACVAFEYDDPGAQGDAWESSDGYGRCPTPDDLTAEDWEEYA